MLWSASVHLGVFRPLSATRPVDIVDCTMCRAAWGGRSAGSGIAGQAPQQPHRGTGIVQRRSGHRCGIGAAAPEGIVVGSFSLHLMSLCV